MAQERYRPSEKNVAEKMPRIMPVRRLVLSAGLSWDIRDGSKAPAMIALPIEKI